MASPRLIITVLILCVVSTYGYTPATYYMDEECSFRITSTKDARLRLTYHSNTHLFRNWQCTTSFRTTVIGDRLQVRLRTIDTPSTFNCRQNSLQILDSDQQTSLNGRFGDCGTVVHTRTYQTSGSSVTFKFKTDSSFQYGQFDILITSFNTADNGTCAASRFICDNDLCISKTLTCNGYNDCGDDSDEIYDCRLSGGAIAGIAIGVVFFLVICTFFAVVGRARRRRYQRICEAKPYRPVQTTTTVYPNNAHTQYQKPSYQTY
ncbi:neuropilin and tolloid-like protein 2 [Haliotis rubra]|uniref:neuropilin and tolloid-like protein 2 n=1 Tax=Haliotis rubra TaxID=36100 RepID=UPI001EE52003|nr:neuropilin and tolloid-like protein 2 [Haliotis rubra]